MNDVPDSGFRKVIENIRAKREKEPPVPPKKESGELIVTLADGTTMTWQSYWRRFVVTVIDRN